VRPRSASPTEARGSIPPPPGKPPRQPEAPGAPEKPGTARGLDHRSGPSRSVDEIVRSCAVTPEIRIDRPGAPPPAKNRHPIWLQYWPNCFAIARFLPDLEHFAASP